jgi:acetyl esterase/lipase
MAMIRFPLPTLVIGMLAVGFLLRQADAAKPDIRVMSFNIRYGTAQDGANHWDRRKEFLVETIRTFDPDLLGTQETLGFQRDYLAKALPEHDVLGVGRDDGKERGEMTALYYRRDRFEKLDEGHFWLSETPGKPGSKSWDSAITRMVTWVRLRDRRQAGGPPLVFFNTHFDHMGAAARLESAKLLRRQIADVARGQSVIVTGDFNTGEESPPYQALFGAINDEPSPIVDTFRLTNPDRRPDEGTFSSFKGDRVVGARIDWIAASRDWQIRSAAIDRTAREGSTPSDHFPVTAILRWKSPRPANTRVSVEKSTTPLYGGNYEVEVIRDINYFEGDNPDPRKHKLNLFRPVGVENYPVLFFIHGGAWTSGDRRLYGFLGEVFAKNGVGTVVISYRLSPGVKHPAHIEDVARAFKWTHQHIAEYGGWPDRIFVSGQSAGGHLAALLCTDEKYLKAQGLSLKDVRGAIPISGIYSFRSGELPFIIGKGPDAAQSASPQNHVSGDEPPFLILYASDDFPNCAGMSQRLHDALRAAGVESACLEVPHRNHLTIIFQPILGAGDTTVQTMLKFIARHSELKLAPRTPESSTENKTEPAGTK